MKIRAATLVLLGPPLCIGLALAATSCAQTKAGPPVTTTRTSKTAQPRRQAARRPAPPRPASKPAVPATLPAARRQGLSDVLHGQEVPDPYRWLEDGHSEAVKKWAAAQDRFARNQLAALPGRDALARRISELSYLDWVSPPSRKGTRYFFTRQHPDKEKVVYYWREGEDGDPRVLIDPNLLSTDGSVALRGVFVSYDGKWAAYKLSRNASDAATLHVMEVATGRVSKIDTIEGARYAAPSWTPESDGFYYTRLPAGSPVPEADLPGQAAVYFHRLGKNPKSDALVRRATQDPKTFIAADLSRDGRFLFLYIQHGWKRTDLYYQDLQRSGGRSPKFERFAVGREALYTAYAWKGSIYVHTNEDAPRYRLFKVDATRIEREHWKEIVPERKDAVLESFAVVGDHLALQYLSHATSRLELATLEGKRVRQVRFPGLGSASGLTGNPEDDDLYYSFSSFTTPPTVYRTSVTRGGRRVYFKLKVPLDPSRFSEEQVTYKSQDGTPVTMFIIRHKRAARDGRMPFILTGYGGFNVSLTPGFSASRFAWLEQGGGLAVPNLRGGGEYGESWHEAGMLANKQHTFDDFLAAADYLIAKRYTSSDRLAISGGSNGGLLVGAAMTQRPELFRAVSCHVPLLDMIRYHLYGSGKTWISEYGSSDEADQFRALLAYSPYHRVKSVAYPALLMLSADSDDRVDPMHARKFTAAIQHATTSGRPVLLRVETKAGHGGGDMIKKRVELAADEYAFLMSQLGITPRPVAPPSSSAH